MIKYLLSILLFFMLSANGFADFTISGRGAINVTSNLTDIRDGLVGHWKINEGTGTVIADSSGQGNNGTATGMAWYNDPVKGWSGSFDGVDDYIEFGTSTLTSAEYSFTAWINSGTNTPTYQTIIAKTAWRYWFSLSGSLNPRLKLYHYYSGNHANAATNEIVLQNKWYHVIGVVQNNRGILYINGEKESLSAAILGTGNIDLNLTAKLRIGRTTDNVYPIKGYIQKVRVYNRALNDVESLHIYYYDYTNN